MSSRKRKISMSSEDGGSPRSPAKSSKAKNYRSRLCSVPGCTKQVQQGGVCCKHGAKTVRAKCSAKNCTNVAKRGGLCRKHGAFDLETCEHVKCKRVVKIKGGRFCEVHAGGGGSSVNAAPTPVTAISTATFSPMTKSNKAKKKKKAPRAAPKICAYQGCSSTVRREGRDLCGIHHNTAAVNESEKIVIRQEDPAYASDMMNLQSFCVETGSPASGISRSVSGGDCSTVTSTETATTQEVKVTKSRKPCDHRGCRNEAVYDGVCVSHGAMQRVYASNRRVGSDDDSSRSSVEGILNPQEGTTGGDLADIGQLDFLCDYYEDMYEQLS